MSPPKKTRTSLGGKNVAWPAVLVAVTAVLAFAAWQDFSAPHNISGPFLQDAIGCASAKVEVQRAIAMLAGREAGDLGQSLNFGKSWEEIIFTNDYLSLLFSFSRTQGKRPASSS